MVICIRDGITTVPFHLLYITLILHITRRGLTDMTNKERYRLTDKGKNILKNLKPTKCRPGFMDRLNKRIDRIDRGEE